MEPQQGSDDISVATALPLIPAPDQADAEIGAIEQPLQSVNVAIEASDLSVIQNATTNVIGSQGRVERWATAALAPLTSDSTICGLKPNDRDLIARSIGLILLVGSAIGDRLKRAATQAN